MGKRADDEERAQWVAAYRSLGSHLQVGAMFGRCANTIKAHLIEVGVFIVKDKASVQRGRRRTIEREIGTDVLRKAGRKPRKGKQED